MKTQYDMKFFYHDNIFSHIAQPHGPHNICGHLLKSCKKKEKKRFLEEDVFYYIFNRFLQPQCISFPCFQIQVRQFFDEGLL